MKFCPVVPEICGGQRSCRKLKKERRIIITIIIRRRRRRRNGAKTISLQTLFGRLKNPRGNLCTE
jgi:hypothetical protein